MHQQLGVVRDYPTKRSQSLKVAYLGIKPAGAKCTHARLMGDTVRGTLLHKKTAVHWLALLALVRAPPGDANAPLDPTN